MQEVLQTKKASVNVCRSPCCFPNINKKSYQQELIMCRWGYSLKIQLHWINAEALLGYHTFVFNETEIARMVTFQLIAFLCSFECGLMGTQLWLVWGNLFLDQLGFRQLMALQLLTITGLYPKTSLGDKGNMF